MQPLGPGDPQQIAGYRLLARLGVGGMGRVFLGVSPGGRPVAVKVARAELADDPVFRERFRREVTLARRVQAFCTAPVVDADPEAASPWLATVYVPGPSLQYAVRELGPLPAATVRTLTAGLAEVLTSVHADGIVHRDLKPSNVLLAQDGPRLIDFGISRALEGTALTRTGLLVGSPGFMAPEQVRGGTAGPPADVFSLGATMTFALTGHGPFGEGTPHAVLFRAVTEPPDLAGLPADLRPLIARCLDKDPDLRPTARQLLEQLTGVAAAGQGPAPGSAPGWLPDPVATMAEERETALLALPVHQGASQGGPWVAPQRAAQPATARPPVQPARPPVQPARPPVQPARQPSAESANPYAVKPQGSGPYRFGPTPWPRNGLGTSSLVCGLLGVVGFWGPGLVLGVVGLLLGIGGIRRANRRQATNRGVAIAGALVSVLAILLSFGSLADAAERNRLQDNAGSGSSGPPAAVVALR